MRFQTLLLASVLAAIATGADAETILSPSGQPMNKASCKNAMDCLGEAGRTCGGSYQVLDSESHAGGIFADFLPGPVTWYSMLYQCGPSDGRMPSFEFRGPEWRPPSTASCAIVGQSIYCWGTP